MRGLERWTPTAGTPQGAVISPLLANIYLHPLDELMAARGHRMVRYADDFVVLCKSREEADAALAEIRAWVAENGLRLHPDKTHVGDCRQGRGGLRVPRLPVRAGRRFVRKKSLTRLKDSIREKTRRTRGDSLARIIADLNPMLQRLVRLLQARPSPHLRRRSTSSSVDGCARSCASRRSGPASDDARADQQRWPNAFFAKPGCSHFTQPGSDGETLPMRKPPTGEPYAGKPPVRFGGRGGRNPSRPLSVISPAQLRHARGQLVEQIQLLDEAADRLGVVGRTPYAPDAGHRSPGSAFVRPSGQTRRTAKSFFRLPRTAQSRREIRLRHLRARCFFSVSGLACFATASDGALEAPAQLRQRGLKRVRAPRHGRALGADAAEVALHQPEEALAAGRDRARRSPRGSASARARSRRSCA